MNVTRLSQGSPLEPRGQSRLSLWLPLLLLAALCALAYLPTLSIPLIEDDYPNLWESQMFGPPAAVPSLLHNSVFRLRATSSWTMWQMWQAFHLDARAYHAFSLLLHIANAWLLFGVVLVLARRGRIAGLRSVPQETPDPVSHDVSETLDRAQEARGAGVLAFGAAAFFAVAEGHQEAVMWFSAINELWMFFFGMASLLCWILAGGAGLSLPGGASGRSSPRADGQPPEEHAESSPSGRKIVAQGVSPGKTDPADKPLEGAKEPSYAPSRGSLESRPQPRALALGYLLSLLAELGPARRPSSASSSRACPTWLWLAASWLLFALALVSKETAVVFLPLFLLAGWAAGIPWKRALAGFAPHLALAAVALGSIAQSSGESFRFADGSFSLHAPFWLIWPRGMARVLGIWGGLALAAILWLRDRGARRAAYFALAWAGIALAPYSFLTYSRQIPSRQTYLASAGVAMLVGLAFCYFRWRPKPAFRAAALTIVIAAMLISNDGYIWTRKRAQFIARAAPTEALIRVARQAHGPIWVRCFPRAPYIAEEAVELGAGRSPSDLLWSKTEASRRPPAAVFCFDGATAASRR